MLISSLALFASALSFQLTCYNNADEVIYNAPLVVSRLLDTNNDYGFLSVNNSFSLDTLDGIDASDITRFKVDAIYSSFSDAGSSQNKCFSYELKFSYDEHDRAFILPSTDAGYVSGYFGQGNLIVDEFTCSVQDYISSSYVTYKNAYYNYLYYDNLADAFDFTGLNTYNEINPHYFSFFIKFKIVPLSLYNLIDGAMSNNDGSYENGYNNGLSDGYDDGLQAGYQSGYADAKANYDNQDDIVNSIFSGILSIGLIPVEFLMSIFNFEVLGINFAHIVSAILTIMVTIILLRVILGGKNGDK